MYLIDSHTHLFLSQFENDIDLVIKRSVGMGIEKMINPNVDVKTIDLLLNLCQKYPNNCFPAMGLHPSSVKAGFENDLKIIENQFDKYKFCAVGECGIDLYWDKTFLEQQKIAFIHQIKLAKNLKLPIIIHTRDAFKEVFEIIDNENDNTLFGVFHCFSGDLKQAEKIIEYGGFKLGIGGVLTYKKSGLAEVIKVVDLKHIVLETDSPFLPPQNYRGKRNESSYLLDIAKYLSEIKRLSLTEISEITTKNANEIFFS